MWEVLEKFQETFFCSSRIFYIYGMNKRQLIDKAELILLEAGFERMDFIFSLQGPTCILTTTGEGKMKTRPGVKAKLVEMGIYFL